MAIPSEKLSQEERLAAYQSTVVTVAIQPHEGPKKAAIYMLRFPSPSRIVEKADGRAGKPKNSSQLPVLDPVILGSFTYRTMHEAPEKAASSHRASSRQICQHQNLWPEVFVMIFTESFQGQRRARSMKEEVLQLQATRPLFHSLPASSFWYGHRHTRKLSPAQKGHGECCLLSHCALAKARRKPGTSSNKEALNATAFGSSLSVSQDSTFCRPC